MEEQPETSEVVEEAVVPTSPKLTGWPGETPSGPRSRALTAVLITVIFLGILGAGLWWRRADLLLTAGLDTAGVSDSAFEPVEDPVPEPTPPVPATVIDEADPAPGAPSTPAEVDPEPTIPVADEIDLVAIQVASFRTRSRADRVLAAVEERTGLKGAVLPSDVSGVLWHRILLGAFPTEEEATDALRLQPVLGDLGLYDDELDELLQRAEAVRELTRSFQ